MTATQYLVGTTGSGKTELALHLATTTPTCLISADSRQVYRGMDIVTGKDHPKSQIIYGIDLVDPSEPCSVGVWNSAVTPIIENAVASNQQVIVVGGTGLYVRSLLNPIDTINVPINVPLRQELEMLSVSELEAKLLSLNPQRASLLNTSDRHNPRRLVRAIEVAIAGHLQVSPPIEVRVPLVGLYYQDSALQKEAIRARVMKRLDLGAISETKHLMSKYPADLPSFTALGYQSIIAYLNQDCSYDSMIESWVHAELAYTKRQLTYFRRQNVTWYDRGRMSIEEIYEHLSS